MSKLLALALLFTTAAASFGVQAKVRSCNFTVKVYGCARAHNNGEGVRCDYNRDRDFLGSKSGTMEGSALTAFGARFEARKNVYFRTKDGSSCTVPIVNTYPYLYVSVRAEVSGDNGCNKDRSFVLKSTDLPNVDTCIYD